MANKIVKTMRLPDDQVMRMFIEKQNNFSKAVTYLIGKYCQEVGWDNIEDLSEVLQREQANRLYGLAPASQVMTAPPPHIREDVPVKHEAEPSPRKSTTIIPSTPDIPSCYQ